MESVELLARFGVKVVEVPEMADAVCFVPTQRVGLIRADMPADEHVRAVDWLLFAAATA